MRPSPRGSPLLRARGEIFPARLSLENFDTRGMFREKSFPFVDFFRHWTTFCTSAPSIANVKSEAVARLLQYRAAFKRTFPSQTFPFVSVKHRSCRRVRNVPRRKIHRERVIIRIERVYRTNRSLCINRLCVFVNFSLTLLGEPIMDRSNTARTRFVACP